jgi:hypothetical protein
LLSFIQASYWATNSSLRSLDSANEFTSFQR